MSTKTANWRNKLDAARALAKQGAALVYDRVVLLRDVYDDAAFLNDCDRRDASPLEELNDEVADTAMTFVTLQAMLDKFPNREDWEARRLQDMAAEIVVARSKTKSKDAGRLSWKKKYQQLLSEFEALQRKHEILEARLEERRAA